ncbi:uncharacterized protein Z518_05740 [Rhinocladiella mackenziei CBS 650.93]|uniref:UBC core domain-containing protein n=1 Tax=Rhinocladiella mackenziei CBS 650.93 TaxID=1442369 RepID=A0A0D2IGG1_9EURO|nr:uncharacterized protein Z518_05740 [Rhinocladiella mackenziei CBS 650.93]KIX04869.1 hypothetical protein Z518_05740 [Rhinocladiella mackenziei CBS 650.93]
MATPFRRLAKDHAALRHSLPPNYLFPESDGASSLPEDLTQLVVLITGAEGTPYAHGLWRLHLKMPNDYPKNPPKATFKTRIYHPNVEESTGAVCLETLKRDWDPKLTLKDILVTISCLLIQPNPDSALNAAAGALVQEDYEAFSTQAKLMTSIHAPIPRHLIKAVQDAKRRGEDDGAETLESGTKPEAQNPQEEVEEDNTKENETTGLSSSAVHTPVGMRTNARGKRPLSELPSPGESDQHNESNGGQPLGQPVGDPREPTRKSPKLVRPGPLNNDGGAQIPDSAYDHEEEKENMTSTSMPGKRSMAPAGTMSRPTALRKVSNLVAGKKGQPPRVGIRRL